MKKIPSYYDDLMKRLKKPTYAIDYLNATLEDNDPRVFLLALKDVVKAHTGITKLSGLTRISREHLYRLLSKKGNPEFKTLQALLAALDLKISIEAKPSARKAA